MARRTKAEAEETRQKILDAAERLFFVDGVSRTSLELIANAAGVTRGAIYWHFKNKVELFEALHERVKLPAEDIVERAMADGHPDPLGLVEQAMVESFIALTEDEQRQRVFTILTCRCEYVGEMLAALARQREAHDHMRATMSQAFTMARELRPAEPGLAARRGGQHPDLPDGRADGRLDPLRPPLRPGRDRHPQRRRAVPVVPPRDRAGDVLTALPGGRYSPAAWVRVRARLLQVKVEVTPKFQTEDRAAPRKLASAQGRCCSYRNSATCRLITAPMAQAA